MNSSLSASALEHIQFMHIAHIELLPARCLDCNWHRARVHHQLTSTQAGSPECLPHSCICVCICDCICDCICECICECIGLFHQLILAPLPSRFSVMSPSFLYLCLCFCLYLCLYLCLYSIIWSADPGATSTQASSQECLPHSCICVYIYVCICVCICDCICICICVCICVCTCVCICLFLWLYLYLYFELKTASNEETNCLNENWSQSGEDDTQFLQLF